MVSLSLWHPNPSPSEIVLLKHPSSVPIPGAGVLMHACCNPYVSLCVTRVFLCVTHMSLCVTRVSLCVTCVTVCPSLCPRVSHACPRSRAVPPPVAQPCRRRAPLISTTPRLLAACRLASGGSDNIPAALQVSGLPWKQGNCGDPALRRLPLEPGKLRRLPVSPAFAVPTGPRWVSLPGGGARHRAWGFSVGKPMEFWLEMPFPRKQLKMHFFGGVCAQPQVGVS